MGEFRIRMPDVGEGIAEAELVEWHVAPGDMVREDQIIAAVMTDKATVEIPSTRTGKVVALGGEVGKAIAIGSELIRLEVEGEGNIGAEEPPPAARAEAPKPVPEAPKPAAAPAPAPVSHVAAPAAPAVAAIASPIAPRAEGEKPIASPAVRDRARKAGIDLRRVAGSGPAGRITHDDLDRALSAPDGGVSSARPGLRAAATVKEIKVVGLRRKIAEKMAISRSRIPHITYMEEIDVTDVERLRAKLNAGKREDQPKLTFLPFLVRAMVIAIRDEPVVNALYDDAAGVVRQYGGVHVGIAAQTPTGLVVPVVKHAEARDLWGCAAEINRLAAAAKSGAATREELTGSTITITSLGPLGGLAHTPIINHPEVAIFGVNKMQMRPMWDGEKFVPRMMMNTSSSFDHRIVDGWNAATFVQRVKALLEEPAMIFMEA